MTIKTRRQKRNIKKKKLLISIGFIPIMLISAVLIYGYLQYKSAFESSVKESVIDRTQIEFNPVKSTDDKHNVLLLGIDARNEEKSRTDTIMIAQYDGKTKSTKIISIMRDSYVEIPDYGYNKINAAHAFGGVELLRKTLKLNFDVDVHYYAIVDFNSFSKVVDVAFPDGIEIDIEKEMSKGINSTLFAGTHKLNGDQLLDYVRFRQDAESDFGRVRRQQDVLKVLTSEFSEINNLVKLPQILGTITPHIKTNMENSLLFSIGPSILFENKNDIESIRIPLEGTYTDERYENAGAVLGLDIEENKNAMQDFFN
ncbi:LCP family protein [Sutcliffiella halmapala]|uniref:LCP family protein n=1 Tax=Sutcliffiella halmapala TaxID=79882 RepID=UPI000994E82D|nr:LCP family protein [Sutcliffiella halmapala]